MSKTLVLILGMHRSGTSALAGSLALMGVHLGAQLVPPGPDNPKGFFEHDAIWRIHQNLLEQLGSDWHDIRPLPDGWLDSNEAEQARMEIIRIIHKEFTTDTVWGLKDPRLSRTLPLWQPIFEALDIQPRIIRLLRHPQEVAASLVRRDHLGQAHALALWLRYTLDAENNSQPFLRSLVHYPDLLQDWRSILARIHSDLGILSDIEIQQQAHSMDAFLDQGLRHHHENSQQGINNHLGQTCNQLYEYLLGQYNGISDEHPSLAFFEESIPDIQALQEQIAHHLQQCQEQKKHIFFLKTQQEEAHQNESDPANELQRILDESQQNIRLLTQKLADRDQRLLDVYHSRSWRWTKKIRQLNVLIRTLMKQGV